MGIPVIEQVKIQAEVLVPLVKTLQVELGEERANGLIRNALGGVYRRLGEQWWRPKPIQLSGRKRELGVRRVRQR
jgi:hypothetical protein